MSIIKKIVSEISKREGGKSNVKVGDVREIVGIIADRIYHDDQEWEDGFENNPTWKELLRVGKNRAKRKK